jgi:septum formation protein
VSISPETPLVLGSASPRRREILTGLGLPISVVPADVEESIAPGETPQHYIERVVADKLRAAAGRARDVPCAGLLVADTIVVEGGEILGKPADTREAEVLLGRLAGRTHVVFTRYAIAGAVALDRAIALRTIETRVSMRAASRDELARYAATGEGMDKAGAYAAQGIGAFLIERIDGSYTNVVGLPACEVVLDLLSTGLISRFP